MGAVLGSGGVLIAAYTYMQKNVVGKLAPKTSKGVPKKKKQRMTMKESAKFLLSSQYIRDLALLVV